MKLQNDIQAYKSAKQAKDELYAIIGDDLNLAKLHEQRRIDAIVLVYDCAENIIMSVMGEKRAQLKDLGIYEFFEEMAAGCQPNACVKIAELTIKHFDK